MSSLAHYVRHHLLSSHTLLTCENQQSGKLLRHALSKETMHLPDILSEKSKFMLMFTLCFQWNFEGAQSIFSILLTLFRAGGGAESAPP